MQRSGFIMLLVSAFIISCSQARQSGDLSNQKISQNDWSSWNGKEDKIAKPGAEQTNLYFDKIKAKSVGIVANQTSLIGQTHLVDSLLSAGINVVKVFSPEHGFRGQAEAGEHVNNNKDTKTGLPLISLYGDHRKPTPVDLEGIDIVIFDLQDVGARFYTYISTLTLVMEACAENGIPLLVLDRPNPNGFYIDGPLLEPEFSSFVGMHPIPVVHGLTLAEYARMVNGELWLKNSVQCKLDWIKVEGYDHKTLYRLPVRPSPNLPDMESVYLYPSLCLFEGTIVSVGRGTDFPFSIIGYPEYKDGNYGFTPESRAGASLNPPQKGNLCNGFNLRNEVPDFINKPGIRLKWLIMMYNASPDKDKFFNSFFNKLAGTAMLKQQIESGLSEDAIRATWKPGLEKFQAIRQKYLLYQDF